MLEKKRSTKTASLSKTVLAILFNKQFHIIAKKIKVIKKEAGVL